MQRFLLLQKSAGRTEERGSLPFLGRTLFIVVAQGGLGTPLGCFGPTSLSRLLKKWSHFYTFPHPTLIRLLAGEICV